MTPEERDANWNERSRLFAHLGGAGAAGELPTADLRRALELLRVFARLSPDDRIRVLVYAHALEDWGLP